MSKSRITLEHALYGLALLLAVCLRLFNLGASPLADGEAGLALQALEVVRGGGAAFGTQPAGTALTGLAFALFGSNDFTARLWPALAGSLLVLLPYCFRGLLGRPAALVLAAGLATDPGLVELSRQANGPMLAVSFSLLAAGLAYNRLDWGAGIAAGLALLSGAAFWPGVLGLGLAWGLSWFLGMRFAREDEIDEPDPLSLASWDRVRGKKLLFGALATVLLVGTLFLRAPQGVSSWLAGLPSYLSGWGEPSSVPPLRLLVALPVYQPLALIFALVGIARGWLYRERWSVFLSLWLVISLILALLYPARQVTDLVWMLIPLWALAALALGWLLSEPLSRPVVSFGLAALLFALGALIWSNLAALGQLGPEAPDSLPRLGVVAGVLALGGVTAALVGLGWSWGAARQGLVLGLLAIFGVYGLASMWGVTQRGDAGRLELWEPVPDSADIRLLVQTAADLSAWDAGETNGADVTLAVESPSIRWALRGFPRLSLAPEGERLLAGGSPSIVITPQDVEEPLLAAAYRGQDFIVRTYPGWTGALPPNFTSWLVFRRAPQVEVQAILWARADLFPGGTGASLLSPPEELEAP